MTKNTADKPKKIRKPRLTKPRAKKYEKRGRPKGWVKNVESTTDYSWWKYSREARIANDVLHQTRLDYIERRCSVLSIQVCTDSYFRDKVNALVPCELWTEALKILNKNQSERKAMLAL